MYVYIIFQSSKISLLINILFKHSCIIMQLVQIFTSFNVKFGEKLMQHGSI